MSGRTIGVQEPKQPEGPCEFFAGVEPKADTFWVFGRNRTMMRAEQCQC